MQVIIGLLRLYSEDQEDAALRKLFADMVGRIEAMALVQRMIYDSADLEHIDVSRYLATLVEATLANGRRDGGSIRFKAAGEPFHVEIENAAAIGLVVNELAMNTCKFAFAGPQGGQGTQVSLEIKTKGDQLVIRYRDNGSGLPEGFDRSSWGTGMQLSLSVVEVQLRGTMTFTNADGLLAELLVPIEYLRRSG
jgi:two-component sensor histidine kinase